MASKNTGIRINENLVAEIEQRGKLGTVVNRDLERLYDLYRAALVDIKLTVNEALLIVDALNGSLYDTRSAAILWGGIEDACRLEGLDEKWDVNGAELVQKLHSYENIQCLAIVDAAERFWQATPDSQPTEDFNSLVKKCFLIP